jgi:hypothetical protein
MPIEAASALLVSCLSPLVEKQKARSLERAEFMSVS